MRTALCSLSERYLQWPTEEEKISIKRHFKRYYGFPDVVGCIDGTLLRLYQAPSQDRNSYATRKNCFTFGATGVCDHRGVFIYFSTGYVGSIHDSAVYKDGKLFTEAHRYFQGEDYLLGDAAYALSTTLMTRYKGNNLIRDQNDFNKVHASARTKIEHGFGILKSQFRSLTNLRMNIDTNKGIRRACHWIYACVVLHNFLLTEGCDTPNAVEDEFGLADDAEDEDEMDDEDDDVEPAAPQGRRRGRRQGPEIVKRNRIMAMVLRHFGRV